MRNCLFQFHEKLKPQNKGLQKWGVLIRAGNQAGRTGLSRANSGLGQNQAGSKLTRFFRVKILTVQPALKIGLVGPNSLFKAKKIRSGRAGARSYWAEPYWTGPNLPDFFRANNLMAQPGPNSGRTELAHRIGPILLPLILISQLLF